MKTQRKRKNPEGVVRLLERSELQPTIVGSIPLKRNCQTMTTFAFLNEHPYQVALRGGYQEELEQVKDVLPTLQHFKSAGELLKTLGQDTELRTRAVSELEALWQNNYDLRPSTGIILMLILKVKAKFANADYWYDYFVKLAEGGAV